MTSKTKKILEDSAAQIVGVGEIPEGDINNLVAEPIRPEEAALGNKGTALIYVGPTNKYITRYTVYKNGYPAHLRDQMKECKLLKSLFIPPEKLAEFEQNVVRKGSVEDIWFQEALKYFNKGVRK